MDASIIFAASGIITVITSFVITLLGTRQSAKKSDFDILQQTISVLQTQVDRLQSENHRLSNEIEEFRNRETLLREQVNDLRDENAWLKIKLRENGIEIPENPRAQKSEAG